ncbi:MAG: hypothetical protein LBP80_09820 [Treponema sp.]|jgi:hypothetical protein|nr:hypothetical protein [Treponema sp.]
MRLFLTAVFITALFFPTQLASQTEAAQAGAGDSASGPDAASVADGIPSSFRGFSLGMDLDALKAALEKDGLFNFRGDRDVSFLPNREQSLIETTGLSFIRRAFFQLRDGKLFIMAFNLDTSLVDHYSVYTSFVKKYGEPAALNPREAVWESEGVRAAIERPLTVKYIDKQVFNEVIAESETAESAELLRRKEFLDDF